MEFDPRSDGTTVFQAMEATEPGQAAEAVTSMVCALHDQGDDPLDLLRAWESFLRLLERRGYYTAPPSELRRSLKEILDLGAGFDLYELGRSLAQYDCARTKCLKLSQARLIPELRSFATSCGCPKGRKES